ncbi:MAG: AAA family ATPase, partial [Holophagales bacterium]|nr:AAA family ATPase [Holophagales bacterium]
MPKIPALKLHGLEISGFKSFPDPVEVRFAEGITAIVGPNGCGKSNLTDAINWVLGEQSAKSLRGTKMEDVIFAGSARRKPIGMAEVQLSFACEPGFPRSENGRITLGRQVFRTGESRYRVNGKVVRLKEIRDLLMDTGLGIRAYSVIEQGRIGMILSGKPQERRKLLEEAAGITRYKARKRVAEVKLEETLANLMRLDDIISEVERSLRSLKRQASAARRYQAKEKEYKDQLRQVLLGRWSLQKAELDRISSQLEGLGDKEAALTAGLAKDEAALVAGRETLDAMSAELADRHQVVAGLAATIEGRQEFLKGARQRSEEIGERLTQGRRQAEEREKETHALGRSLGSLDERTRAVVQERDEAARAVAEDERRIAGAQAEVEAAERRLETLRRDLLASASRLDGVRSRLQKETVDLERIEYRLRYLDEQRTRLDRQLAEFQGYLDEAAEKIHGAEARIAEGADTRRRLDTELESVLRREAEVSEERRQLETHLAGLRQRQKILVQLSHEHEERRRSLERTLAGIGIESPRYLADSLAPVEGWESAVDHFLGELADAVLLEPGSGGLQAAKALSEANASGVFVRPLEDGSPLPELADEAIAFSLAEALDLPAELARALPPAFLVDRAEDAERLAASHPGIAFLTRDRVWARGGGLWVQGGEAAPGVLARESELQSIAEEIPDTENRLEEAKELLAGFVRERTRLAAEIQKVDDLTSELRRELAVAQARRQDVDNRRQKVLREHESVAGEQEELNGKQGEKSTLRETLRAELATAEGGQKELEAAVDTAQAEVEASRARREALRTEGAGRRGRLDLLEERLEAQSQEVVRVRRQITYTEEQLRVWAQEDGTLNDRLDDLAGRIDQAEHELREALSHQSVAQEAVLEQQQRLDAQRQALRGKEETVERLRAERDRLVAEIGSLRVEQASARQHGEHLSVTYRESFHRHIPGTRPPEPEADGQLPLPGTSSEDEDEAAAVNDEGRDVPGEAAEGDADAPADEGRGTRVEEADSEGAPGDDSAALDPRLLPEDDVEIPILDRHRLAELEAELSRTKATLERLGPVNVLAAQEYEEQHERLGFLREQRKDVADSVSSLKRTIAEINEQSSVRFKETFEQVNVTFGITFERLFRGGEAYMRLFDEEDLLESGIEIV